LFVLHLLPHVPQLFTSVPTDVSQSVPGLPGQCAKPWLQLPTSHIPPVHAGVPLAVTQTIPHPPQLPVDVCVLTSQPSLGSLLQSANPGAHDVI
jgi:hypothetical protein